MKYSIEGCLKLGVHIYFLGSSVSVNWYLGLSTVWILLLTMESVNNKLCKLLGPNPGRIEGPHQQCSFLGSYSRSSHIISIFLVFLLPKHDIHFCIIPSCWLITNNFIIDLFFNFQREKVIIHWKKLNFKQNSINSMTNLTDFNILYNGLVCMYFFNVIILNVLRMSIYTHLYESKIGFHLN